MADYIKQIGNILGGVISVSPDNGKAFNEHIQTLLTDGQPAGENAIIAPANICHREVHIYIAYSEPLIYSATGSKISMYLLIWFFINLAIIGQFYIYTKTDQWRSSKFEFKLHIF